MIPPARIDIQDQNTLTPSKKDAIIAQMFDGYRLIHASNTDPAIPG